MKCDELKATTAQEIVRNEKDCDYMDELFGGVKMPPAQVYFKSDVDTAIDELKAEHHKERHEYIKMVAELKAKLEDAKASAYAESVDAGMRERRLKRALWLARAERARDKALIFYFAMTESHNLNINGYSNEEKGLTSMRHARWWRITWLKVERKCRAKMEEYK